MDVQTNLEEIQENIRQACERSNRNTDEITLIGVTKYVTIERAEETIRAGVENIGENRTDELLHKYEQIKDKAKWHFIGTLQSRKVKEVVNEVEAIHSLDRLSVAKQINSRSDQIKDCFIQVNISGEETKHGLTEDEVIPFVKQLEPYDKVNIVGLMTMAPHTDDEEELRKVFKALRDLRDRIKKENFPHAPCEYLSMGMSNDYEIAIEEGATHIRIGSKLVGT